MWKKLWAIQCPNKMKVVLWRQAHDWLPTGYQLQVRSIPTSYNCYFCNREETVKHYFLHCHYVKEIWKELKKDYGICLNLKSFTHIRQWILTWLFNATDFHAIVFAVAIWHIWENRNAHRNDEALIHPLRVVGKIKAYIEFINLQLFSSPNFSRREAFTSSQNWSPPPDGTKLINRAAAIFP